MSDDFDPIAFILDNNEDSDKSEIIPVDTFDSLGT